MDFNIESDAELAVSVRDFLWLRKYTDSDSKSERRNKLSIALSPSPWAATLQPVVRSLPCRF